MRSRSGRIALVAALVALAALAGCSALQPTTDAEQNPNQDAPDAYTESGSALDGETLRADHVGSLEEARSFTTTTNLTIESANGSLSFTERTLVDLDRDRALQTSAMTADASDGSLETTTYTAGNATYERFSFGSGNHTSAHYEMATEPYDESSFGGVEPVNRTKVLNAVLVEEAAASVNWTQTGVVERDGTTVTRYEATGRENFSDLRNESALDPVDGANVSALGANVSELRATLLVGPDGLVRSFEFHLAGTADGESVAMTLSVTTTDVGATTVEEPSWLEEARNESSR